MTSVKKLVDESIGKSAAPVAQCAIDAFQFIFACYAGFVVAMVVNHRPGFSRSHMLCLLTTVTTAQVSIASIRMLIAIDLTGRPLQQKAVWMCALEAVQFSFALYTGLAIGMVINRRPEFSLRGTILLLISVFAAQVLASAVRMLILKELLTSPSLHSTEASD
jgi:hypothetical protein